MTPEEFFAQGIAWGLGIIVGVLIGGYIVKYVYEYYENYQSNIEFEKIREIDQLTPKTVTASSFDFFVKNHPDQAWMTTKPHPDMEGMQIIEKVHYPPSMKKDSSPWIIKRGFA